VPDSIIKRRCFYFIGDYEPIDASSQHEYFRLGLQCFAKTWNVETELSPPTKEADGAIAAWQVETKGPNWVVKTEFRLLNWADFVAEDIERSSWDRISRAVKALADFIMSGTCWRYFRLNWRFGFIFLYPMLAALLFTAFAIWLMMLLGNLSVPLAPIFALAITGGLFFAFIKWVDLFLLFHVTRMWIFIYDLVHLERAGLAERLGMFTQDIVERLQSDNFDEIVIAAHGLGAALQPIIVDRAFWQLPEFGKDGRSISLLSIGSLLLAVGLHPEGGWVASPALRIALDRMVYWAEYQAEEDILSFPGRNPITELLSDHGKPVLQKIQIKNMVEPDAKRRFPKSIYQSHRQLVRANSKRYFYDYFMICCGPFSLSTRVQHPDLMVAAFHSDGRLISDV
jgi:hypothetical protein